MSTTSITSGSNFIGKTLVIGSTAITRDMWARVFEFNLNTSNTLLYTFFDHNERHALYTSFGTIIQNLTYTPAINKYYIYTISFLSSTVLKVNVYEYNTNVVSNRGITVKTITMPNNFLSSFTNLWLGRSTFNTDPFYNGRYDKVALYNGDLFALSEANILSTLLTLVTSRQTNIINNSTTPPTYTFRSVGTNFLGVVVNILNYNTATGSNVTTSDITLIGSGTTSGGYLNIIGSYIEPPNEPTSVTAIAGNAQAVVNWIGPTSDAGPVIVFTTVGPHTFRPTTNGTVEVLIVGGGGSGGRFEGGGGGGGGVIYLPAVSVTKDVSYGVVVGRGGVGIIYGQGIDGSYSSVFGATANGGGGGAGATYNSGVSNIPGNPGGSGGGGSGSSGSGGGTILNILGSNIGDSYGNSGGPGTSNYSKGGGGGGAGAAGGNGGGAHGGNGVVNNILGPNYYWGGGGGGGGWQGTYVGVEGGRGGLGGGGGGGPGGAGGGLALNPSDNGAVVNTTGNGGNGATNSGGGGGSSGGEYLGVEEVSGSGGSGIVVIRYKSTTDNSITSYSVTTSPLGGQVTTANGTTTTATFNGLNNGTSYTFTVVATNIAGPSTGASTSITPRTTPDAPTNVIATPGDTSANLSWTAPLNNGGSAITSYSVTTSPVGGQVTINFQERTASVSQLTNGTAYTFTVVATNIAGSSTGASTSITPRTIPDAPTSVIATPGNTSANLSWTAPLNNGGSAITSYSVTTSPVGGQVTINLQERTASVSQLTNGTSYTFTVVATNIAGSSTPAFSTSITPIAPHNLNTPNKQWLMYLNTLSSISGDDLTIKPDAVRNLVLEVSGNNNILIKKGTISFNLTNYITGDVSFSNVDLSQNLNPLLPNNSNLGLPSKVWGNAHIRDISVTNMSVSGTIIAGGTFPNVIQIIPQIANNTSLGTATNIWQRAFIRDLSGITSINGTSWPIIGARGLDGPTGPSGETPGPDGVTPGPPGGVGPTGATGATGPIGPELRVNINTRLTDISNLRLTTKSRIYQNISGSFNDPFWSAINGYYGLAKDAYPALNPYSTGSLAVSTLTSRTLPTSTTWRSVCWSPERVMFVAVGNNKVVYSFDGLIWSDQTTGVDLNGWFSVCWSPQRSIFVAVASIGTNKVMYSSNGINWTSVLVSNSVSWADVCWSTQLGLFLAVGTTTTNRVMYSYDGSSNWTQPTVAVALGGSAIAICWSPELGLFVVVGDGFAGVSSNGITWTTITDYPNASYVGICWSPQLGLFVAVSYGGQVMISSNGINWSQVSVPSAAWYNVCWCAEIGLFIAVADGGERVIFSHNGRNWTSVFIQQLSWESVCWSPELGLAVIVGRNGGAGINTVLTSSLKGRPPTSYNVFDSSFNSIDETGKWTFQNMAVTTMTAGGANVPSDDRLKHNEVIITNGLEVIDKLTPKFYQKTQVLLDASYNGDLSAYSWSLEAGLIAQEVLQISDLSYVVGGGDYYEQKYIYKRQTNDLSYNYYEPSANYYEPSANYYEPSANYYKLGANNYEVSSNLITQAYNLNYNSVFVYGLAAIKELHTKVKTQETTILDEQLNDLVTRIEALESMIQDMSNNIE